MAEENVWRSITKDRIYLDEGCYYIYLNLKMPGSYAYFEGFRNNEHFIVEADISQVLFSVKDGEYPDGFGLVVYIPPGVSFDNYELKPRIVKISDSSEDAENTFWIKPWYITKEDTWEALSEKEIRLTLNRLKYQDADMPWNSIIFDDGSGIQYVDGIYKKGKINSFGVVYLESVH